VVYVARPTAGSGAGACRGDHRKGGLRGYRVVVRPLDDESSDDVAVARVGDIQSALDGGETVLGVIGHLNSGQTSAAMELYKDMPLLVITPTASEQTLTNRGYTNFFRANVQATVGAEFLRQAAGKADRRHPQRHRLRQRAGCLAGEFESRRAGRADAQVKEGQPIS
jgi:hypothetical protein